MLIAKLSIEEHGYAKIFALSKLDEDFLEEIRLGEEGDQIFITIAEMPDEEFLALPEFIGW